MKRKLQGIFKDLVDNLYDGVYLVDTRRRIIYWNKAAETITGYAATEVLGKRCADNILTHTDDEGRSLCLGLCPVTFTLQDGQPREVEAYLHHKDGHRVPVNIRIMPVRDADQSIIGAMELFNDNSPKIALKHRLEELERHAHLDELTQVANRRGLENRLTSLVYEYQRYGWPMGVIFVDIDHFKAVNDTYGHDAGDRVLKAVANNLAANSRPFDLVGRWGGEEFVCLLKNIAAPHLEALAERFRQLVAASYLEVADSIIRVTISLGATLLRPGDTFETALKRADELLYYSKQQGRNRVTTDFGQPRAAASAPADPAAVHA